MNEPTTIIDEIVSEFSEKPPAPPIRQDEPTAKEPQETLDQLMSDWRAKSNDTHMEARPTVDDNALPFLKKEELYDYWRNGTVTEPYIIVAVEHLFGIPHEQWEQIEEDIHAIGRIPGKTPAEDRLQREIDFFNRVLATTIRVKDISQQFVKDYSEIRNNRLHYLAHIRFTREMEEHRAAAKDRNDFYRKNKWR